MGDPEQDSLQEIAWKIQKNIRRHRLQRVILNVQRIKFIDELGVRKLVAAFLRPRKSAIYGATGELMHQFEETYLPGNIRLCPTEKEVAEDLGPFLFEKEEMGRVLGQGDKRHSDAGPGIGAELERRRSKRMHVAIPLEIILLPKNGQPIGTRGISTNISESGIFVEYLDLDALKKLEEMESIEGVPVEIKIHPSSNFPEECRLEGVIKRREFRKRGVGLAIRFSGSPGSFNL